VARADSVAPAAAPGFCDLKPHVAELGDSALSRQLHRMRLLGLIKRVAHACSKIVISKVVSD